MKIDFISVVNTSQSSVLLGNTTVSMLFLNFGLQILLIKEHLRLIFGFL